jgi:CDP-glucose 4,6-dehydratase
MAASGTPAPMKTDVMAEFWRGRRVLLTGHTGFKGAWMSLWLGELGAEVTGYALAPAAEPNLWNIVAAGRRGEKTGGGPAAARGPRHSAPHSVIADIRDAERVGEAVARADPQIVIHMAAQALVRESYRDPLATYDTNVMGTAMLLQACRSLRRLECVVVVTSDKVYENRGEGRAFEEGDRLGGHDPYSNSKACAELVAASFRDSFFAGGPPIATARAGNVIGGGDWSEDRLIPDCVRALQAGKPVTLRYPDAVRPWQHVLEPLSGYLTLAQALVTAPNETPRAVNFGPDPASFCTVREVVDALGTRFAGRPGWVSDPAPQPAEAHALTLSSTLAAHAFGWRPRLDIRESLSWTADWYLAHSAGENMATFSVAQLARYRELMRSAQ